MTNTMQTEAASNLSVIFAAIQAAEDALKAFARGGF